jgi:membrane protein required for colicin V production
MAAPVLSWVDWAMLGLLALSVLAGLSRGLVFELMSLVGWIVAYIVAQLFSPEVASLVPVGERGETLNLLVAFAITFIVVLVAWSLLARLLRMLIHATPLTVPDRVLGGGFGLLRGVLVLLVVATLVAFLPTVQRSAAWTQSQGAAWLGVALQGLKPMLPTDVARHLPA